MTVRRSPTHPSPILWGREREGARGTRLGARRKSRVFDRKSLPLAAGHLPLARKLALTAEALMNNAG